MELGTFFNAIKGLFSDAVSVSIPSGGDTIDHTTGELNGSWTGGTAATYTGTTHGAYAAGTGLYVTWQTSTIRNGRKFLGRTFICPILAANYQDDGTIFNASVSTVQTAASTLAASGQPCVYGRPTSPGGSDGLFAGFTGAIVPDRVTSLRSRRT